MKRGLIATDFHSGNNWGLTSPKYMRDDLRDIQEKFWNWWVTQLNLYKPFDFGIFLGDMTDGEGKKGTLDTFITDMRKQVDNAEHCLEPTGIDPKKMYIARGTPFHTNGALEYEDKIADDLGCSIKDTQKLEVEGWKIHSRHVIGRSDIPYGQATPLLKEISRLEHEAFRDNKSAPDIILRGHVHYECHVGKHGRLAADCPCLELPLSSANGRRYSAWEYDVGFAVLTLEEGKQPIWQPVIMEIDLVHDSSYDKIDFSEVLK